MTWLDIPLKNVFLYILVYISFTNREYKYEKAIKKVEMYETESFFFFFNVEYY